MSGKLKLNAASGGGSVSLQAPSSSSNNRVFTIPDIADGTIDTLNRAGNILQVVSTYKTDTFSMAGTSFVEVTGLNATITPSSSSNKILILTSVTVGASTNSNIMFQLYDGSSVLTAAKNTSQTIENSFAEAIEYGTGAQYHTHVAAHNFLYSANTTSAKTIKIYAQSGQNSSTIYINRSHEGSVGGTSSITLMEVAA